MTEIPQKQRAVVSVEDGKTVHLEVREVPVDSLKPGQILVKINYTGVCASDKSVLYEEWSQHLGQLKSDRNLTKGIAGHEGAGVVVAMAADVQESGQWKIGDRAGVKYLGRVCGICEFCREGKEMHCLNHMTHLSHLPGTFQEYCATYASTATKLPDGVSDEEAGPLMCGGITAYGACKTSQVRPGQWIVIVGAGGGLGHLALQYAKAMGMRPIAIDGGDAKKDLCLKLGAEEYLDFTKTQELPAEVMKLTKLGAHAVIVFASNEAAYAQAPFMLRPLGSLVCVGLLDKIMNTIGAPSLFLTMRGLRIVGSVVGSFNDVDEMLDFTARDLVHPQLTRGKLEDCDHFLNEIKAGTLPGRAVLKVAS